MSFNNLKQKLKQPFYQKNDENSERLAGTMLSKS